MWDKDWRERVWSELDREWDLVIVGGGITGAGILRLASGQGLKTLLVEQRDFAWGTSSRSSKMVHGGLRYLKDGNLALVRESVHERQALLRAGPGLVEPLSFLMPSYKGAKPGRAIYQAALTFYDWLAGSRRYRHRFYRTDQFQTLVPRLNSQNLLGGFQFWDAQTDDARLVLRIISEAVESGATAINYVQATALLFDEAGQVNGVRLRDTEGGRELPVRARVVINATGAWADELRNQVGQASRLRPLRGSHLVFAGWRFPVAQVVSFMHPFDGRPVFVYPWEGVTLVGTTDLDHSETLANEPAITAAETAYLMAAAHALFPALDLSLDDVLASWAGVRPVIKTEQANPSKEPRDHVIWQEKGLLTVTGGKLTTFRVIAVQALQTLSASFPDLISSGLAQAGPVLNPVTTGRPDKARRLDDAIWRRLQGRYGSQARRLIEAALPTELGLIPGTPYLWAELRWAARAEGVIHLDDLLLRRLRLGLLLAGGGLALLAQIRHICQPELGWDDQKWEAEASLYQTHCRTYYGLPERATIPDWRQMLAEKRPDDPHLSTVT